jgi:cell division transport system permease protein
VIGFVLFSIRRAWQGFWRNAVMSLAATATMVLMLVLLAAFWVILTGLNAGLQYVEEKVEIVADLAPQSTALQVQALRDEIAARPEVALVEYVTADEALDRFRARLAEQKREDLTSYLDHNPLPASLEIKLNDPRVYGDVTDRLRQAPIVTSVKEIQKLVDQVLTVTNILRTAGIVILALVGLTVLFIIINTIRLAVVARAEEIEIMRLVGASDAFIRWPFVFEGAMVGLLGAAVTLGLLYAAGQPLGQFMYDFFRVLPLQFGALARDLVLIVVGAGVGLGVVGSWVSVRSYLIR